MGKYLRPGTAACYDYTPDDSDTKMYIEADMFTWSLQTLINRIKEKWPGKELDDISISAEHIHTHAVGYDRYDPSDYTNYLVIELRT